jgi:cell division protein FtsZ
VKAVMQDAGTAVMGIGVGTGERRAADAATEAIASPLLEQSVIGARKLLINVTAGDDLAIGEVEEIVRIVREAADVDEANVFWGLVFNPLMENEVRVTVVATGFDKPAAQPNSYGVSSSGAQTAFSAPAPTPQSGRPVPKLSSDDIDIDVPSFLRRSGG